MVQLRPGVVPRADVFKVEGLTAQVFALRVKLQRAIQEGFPRRVGHFGVDGGRPVQQEADGQGPGGIVLLQPGLQPEVLQVGGRFGVQVHRAEDAAEPEKILVLNPGGAGALVHLHAEAVALIP